MKKLEKKRNWRKCGIGGLRKQTNATHLTEGRGHHQLLVCKGLKQNHLEILNEAVV